MFNNEEDLRKWIKANFPYIEKSDDEIKEEFINNFGIDKWNEFEALSKLTELNFELADFLGIDAVPVIFEEMEEDSRYYLKDDYIAINNKYVNNELECMKCLIHEVKHLHQKYCINHEDEELLFCNDYLLELWYLDFNKDQTKMDGTEIMCMCIEVDAYAFTKYILKNWFDIDYHHYNQEYDMILDMHIEIHYK